VTTAWVGFCPISALLPTSLFPVSTIEMLSASKSHTINSPPSGFSARLTGVRPTSSNASTRSLVGPLMP
jgi:hypothetical protein